MSFLSNLFGGGGSTTIQPSQINYQGPSGFTTGGTTANYSNGQYNINNTPGMNAQIGGLQSTFQQQAGALGQLASTVQPGFSQFRQAGLSSLATQQQANLSNLRDSLAQRRVLGSSFANSQISQSNADYAQNQANFIASSYLSELQASQSLVQQQYQAAAQSYQVGISQMNLDTGVAAQLTSQASALSAQMAQAQAGLDQQAAQFNAQQNAASQAGIGKFFGTLGGAAIGGLLGGPAGLMAGASIGSSAFGGSSGGAGMNYGGLSNSWSGTPIGQNFNFLTQPFNPTGQ